MALPQDTRSVEHGSLLSPVHPIRRHVSAERQESVGCQAAKRAKTAVTSFMLSPAPPRPAGSNSIAFSKLDAPELAPALGFLKDSKESSRVWRCSGTRKAHSALPPVTRCGGATPSGLKSQQAVKVHLPSSSSPTAREEDNKLSAMMLDLGDATGECSASLRRFSGFARHRSTPPGGAKLEPLSRPSRPGRRQLAPLVVSSHRGRTGDLRSEEAAFSALDASPAAAVARKQPLHEVSRSNAFAPSADSSPSAAAGLLSPRRDPALVQSGRTRILPGDTLEEWMLGDEWLVFSDAESDTEDYLGVDLLEFDDEEEDV